MGTFQSVNFQGAPDDGDTTISITDLSQLGLSDWLWAAGIMAVAILLGLTVARLVTTVAMELRRSNTLYGLATQCIGAGMGISTVI